MTREDFDEEIETGMTDTELRVLLISIREYVKIADDLTDVKKYLNRLIKALD